MSRAELAGKYPDLEREELVVLEALLEGGHTVRSGYVEEGMPAGTAAGCIRVDKVAQWLCPHQHTMGVGSTARTRDARWCAQETLDRLRRLTRPPITPSQLVVLRELAAHQVARPGWPIGSRADVRGVESTGTGLLSVNLHTARALQRAGMVTMGGGYRRKVRVTPKGLAYVEDHPG